MRPRTNGTLMSKFVASTRYRRLSILHDARSRIPKTKRKNGHLAKGLGYLRWHISYGGGWLVEWAVSPCSGSMWLYSQNTICTLFWNYLFSSQLAMRTELALELQNTINCKSVVLHNTLFSPLFVRVVSPASTTVAAAVRMARHRPRRFGKMVLRSRFLCLGYTKARAHAHTLLAFQFSRSYPYLSVEFIHKNVFGLVVQNHSDHCSLYHDAGLCLDGRCCLLLRFPLLLKMKIACCFFFFCFFVWRKIVTRYDLMIPNNRFIYTHMLYLCLWNWLSICCWESITNMHAPS